MGDGTGDQIIISNSFNYTYHNKGKYKITQTLHSLGGCVTSDTQIVNVYGNLNNIATNQPIVTIDNNDRVLTYWYKNTDAVNYDLYKSVNHGDLNFYQTQNDTFFTDSVNNDIYRNTYQYAVKLTDQCNQKSSLSISETSILLQGENNHNVYSTLNWNRNNVAGFNYIYDISKWRNYDSSIINNVYTNDYSDDDFYSDSSIKTCYRVSTKQRYGINISSNEVCIDYEPYVIIPTWYDITIYPAGVPVKAFYFKDYTVEIFDLIGRKIFEGNKIDHWNGGDYYTQYFIYRVNGTSKENMAFRQTGKILLVK